MSHGAFHNAARCAINIDDVCKAYPVLKPLAVKWYATLQDYDLLDDGLSTESIEWPCMDMYLDEIANNYSAFENLDDENAENAVVRITEAFSALAKAFKKATGLNLATQWVGSAEDSYADVADEWIWYVTDAEVTNYTAAAKRFMKKGLKFSGLQWTTYG